MKDNTVAYVIWCNEAGKVVDDGTVFCLNQNEFKPLLCSKNANLVKRFS